MGTKFWLFVAGSLFIASISACEAPKRAAPETQSTRSASHWVQNDELQVLMKKLGTSSGEHWPSTLPDDPEVPVMEREQKEAFQNAAKLATDLGNAAGQIPNAVIDLRLSDADRNAFIGTAYLLRDQAHNLKSGARRHNMEEMHKQLDAIRATCISCHTRFKDISGELPPRA